MFLLVLGGSLIFGAGLLAAASYSEGMLLAIRTAAQGIGWLLLLATAVGLSSLRRAAVAQFGAATVTLLGGVAVLYVSYFQWGTVQETMQGTAPGTMQAASVPDAPIRYASTELLAEHEPAELLAAHEPVYKATLTNLEIIAAVPTPAPAPAPMKKVSPVPAIADACAPLTGVESLQCRRCSGKLGVAWIVCRESARLEYCEGRQDEAACPSAIPSANLYSPPG